MSDTTDDLVTRLDALYRNGDCDEQHAFAIVDYWPVLRDRLTAAEAEATRNRGLRERAEGREREAVERLTAAEAGESAANENYLRVLRERTAAKAERDEARKALNDVANWPSDRPVLGAGGVRDFARAFLARLRDRST